MNGTFKNLAGYSYILSRQTKVSFKFNDKYEYTGIVCTAVDHSTSVGQLEATDPLEVVNLYVCSLVPDEIMETFSAVQVEWGFFDLEDNSYQDSNAIPLTTYQLDCTASDLQQDSGEEKEPEEEQKAAEGTPLNALMLDGIRVDLADDLYAFQLEGHQGYAWTADGTCTVAIEKGEGYEIPESPTNRQAFFAQRIADYAASLGWSITRSEQTDLADKLEGYINCADHGDGSSTTYVNIPLSDSDFIQVYVIHPTSNTTEQDSLPERTIAAIRRQSDDDPVGMASNKTTTLEAAGITFECPVRNNQNLSYNALYAFDYDSTLQIMVEPFNGVDIAGHMVNITEDAMSSDPASPEYFDTYCQQFASARGGWIMSKFSTEGDGCTVSVCTIRAEQEVGSVVYTLAATPATMEGTTYQLAMIIARCQLSSGRKWSPCIDAMISSIASTGAGTLTDYNFKRSYGWQVTMPDYFESSSGSSMHDSVMWVDMYRPNNSTCLRMTLSTMIAGYGYYYEFSVIGDTDLKKVQIISEETRDTAGANVLVRKGSEDSNGRRTIVADIHSSTNNALGLSFTYDPTDEEFLMPSINQVIDSIIVG